MTGSQENSGRLAQIREVLALGGVERALFVLVFIVLVVLGLFIRHFEVAVETFLMIDGAVLHDLVVRIKLDILFFIMTPET